MVSFIPALILVAVIFLLLLVFYIFYSRRITYLEEKNKRLSVLRKLDEVMIASSTDLKDVAQKVTDAIAFELGFENGVLALIDESKGVLRRVAMSNTPLGIKAKQSLPIPYEQFDIPLNAEENLSIKAIKSGQREITHDLYDLFVPTFDRALSKKIQETIGVTTSLVYPIKARGKVIGVMIVSIARSESKLLSYEKESIEELFDIIGITLDNATLYSRLKNTSSELMLANEKLKQLDKLKDDFVSIASHELRTPMTAIRSYAWMAINKSDQPLSDKMKKYLTRVLMSTERLINLVNDMLNVSRIESGRLEVTPKSFDLLALTQEVNEEIMGKALEQGVKIYIMESKIPQVFADADKVHQILLNLVGNALKFTPKGGNISIGFFADGNMVDISVKDSGTGMNKEDLGKLFQKFGRLDNSYVAAATTGGTGLGLFISKKLVELMHGKIWAGSEGLGKGSTFSFSLPIATASLVASAEKYHIKPEGEAKGLEPISL
jgi:signal transduction histidine kinase